jgi:allophanate hydrolase
MLVGKTNMDQFATGLVGTRTPYGSCSSVYSPDHVSGGSSSGSALSVACGFASFALGTDTAGSGRVPAAFNGLVGLKPTRGLISTLGVLPACASLDCVSVFAGSIQGAALVLDVLAVFEADDPWARIEQTFTAPRRGLIGIPERGQLELADAEAAAAWERSLDVAGDRWDLVHVDVGPLLAASPLLYAAWVAERTTDLGAAIGAAPEGLDPAVASIVAGGTRTSGTDVFSAIHSLARLRSAAQDIWRRVDALLLPTTPSHPTHSDVAADPVGVNEQLGRFTNSVNLMDLAALAIPGPLRADGLPHGVTLLAPAFGDRRLLELGAEWSQEPLQLAFTGYVPLAVAGAHMRGLPLNSQLTDLGARFVSEARTAAAYRLYALSGGEVRRPGLIRVEEGGASVVVELWEIAAESLGRLITKVPAPLGIGRVTLSDDREIAGFICEGHAASSDRDVTAHGGWRAFLEAV